MPGHHIPVTSRIPSPMMQIAQISAVKTVMRLRFFSTTEEPAREEDVARTAETAIAECGRFDTWVNNAAVSVFGKTTQMTTEDLPRVFDVAFWSVVYGCRPAVAGPVPCPGSGTWPSSSSTPTSR